MCVYSFRRLFMGVFAFIGFGFCYFVCWVWFVIRDVLLGCSRRFGFFICFIVGWNKRSWLLGFWRYFTFILFLGFNTGCYIRLYRFRINNMVGFSVLLYCNLFVFSLLRWVLSVFTYLWSDCDTKVCVFLVELQYCLEFTLTL